MTLALLAAMATVVAATPAQAAGRAELTMADAVKLCLDIDFRGICESVTQDAPSMSGTAIGNDAVSSVQVPAGMYLVLYADAGYRGRCQQFTTDDRSLLGSVIDNDAVSSYRIESTDGGCVNPTSFMYINSVLTPIGHLETYQKDYACPAEFPYVGRVSASGHLDYGVTNRSSANVSQAYEPFSTHFTGVLKVTFTNWNLSGNQLAGVRYVCHNKWSYENDTAPRYSGSWVHYTNRGLGDWNDDVHATASPGGVMRYTFDGTGFRLLGETNSDQADLTISLRRWEDGHTISRRLDCSAGKRSARRVLYSVRGLQSWLGQWEVSVSSGSTPGYWTVIDGVATEDEPQWTMTEQFGCKLIG